MKDVFLNAIIINYFCGLNFMCNYCKHRRSLSNYSIMHGQAPQRNSLHPNCTNRRHFNYEILVKYHGNFNSSEM